MIDQGIYLVIKSRASSFSSPSVPATSRPCPHRLAEIASHRSREKEVTRETPATSWCRYGVRVISFPIETQRDIRASPLILSCMLQARLVRSCQGHLVPAGQRNRRSARISVSWGHIQLTRKLEIKAMISSSTNDVRVNSRSVSVRRSGEWLRPTTW